MARSGGSGRRVIRATAWLRWIVALWIVGLWIVAWPGIARAQETTAATHTSDGGDALPDCARRFLVPFAMQEGRLDDFSDIAVLGTVPPEGHRVAPEGTADDLADKILQRLRRTVPPGT